MADIKITNSGERPMPSAFQEELIRLAHQEVAPGPDAKPYTVVKLRHGGAIGKLIASQTTEGAKGQKNVAVPKELQATLQGLARDTADEGITLQKATAATQLLEGLQAQLPAAMKAGNAMKEGSDSNVGGVVSRMVSLLGADSVQADDMVIRMLASDEDVRERALEITPESHPRLYEVLLLSLSSKELVNYIQGNSSPAAGADLKAKKVSGSAATEDVEEGAEVESPEAKRDRLAVLLADRARYVIPMLVGAVEAQTPAQSSAKSDDNKPNLQRVSEAQRDGAAKRRG